MNLRADSSLSQLTDDQQAQLYDWIIASGFTAAQTSLAAPAPDGFALKVHLTTLRRFYTRYRQLVKQEDLTDAAGRLDHPQPDRGPIRFLTEDNVLDSAFQLSGSPSDPLTFNSLSRWLNRQKNHELRQQQLALEEKRLALDREKFEFNAARAAIIHHAELDEIVQDPQTDNEDKIRRARNALFGKPKPQSL